MNDNINTKDNLQLIPVYHRYISIDEPTSENLSPTDIKVYMALRFEADYSKKCAEVKMTIKYIASKSKVSERSVYNSLNSLEHHHFLIKRINEQNLRYGQTNSMLIAKDYLFFKQKVDNFITPAPNAVETANAAVAPAPPCILIKEHKSFHKSSQREENPLNNELVEIRKDNPVFVLLSDKYLLIQNKLNQECLNDHKSKEFFNFKFNKLDVTFEEMLNECVMYYALKPESQNVSPHRFRKWIKNEHVYTYEKKPDSVVHKLWKDLTNDERTLLSDYNHFMKFPEIQNPLTQEQKNKAISLLDLLQSSKNLRKVVNES
ncbi:MAG: hypothetical protein AABY22_34700 [Nanoarchaeota archaeon]